MLKPPRRSAPMQTIMHPKRGHRRHRNAVSETSAEGFGNWSLRGFFGRMNRYDSARIRAA